MIVLVPCPCLNVTIHLASTPRHADTSDRCWSELLECTGWACALRGTPSMAGVAIQQPVLVFCRSTPSTYWRVYTCVNCLCDVYAISNSDSSLYAVNPTLAQVSGGPLIAPVPVHASSGMRFSPAFHVMVDSAPAVEKGDAQGPAETDGGMARDAYAELQQKTLAFVQQEQKLMTARIQAYIEEEEKQLERVKQHAFGDKDFLWKRVKLAMAQQKRSGSRSPLAPAQIRGTSPASSQLGSPHSAQSDTVNSGGSPNAAATSAGSTGRAGQAAVVATSPAMELSATIRGNASSSSASASAALDDENYDPATLMIFDQQFDSEQPVMVGQQAVSPELVPPLHLQTQAAGATTPLQASPEKMRTSTEFKMPIPQQPPPHPPALPPGPIAASLSSISGEGAHSASLNSDGEWVQGLKPASGVGRYSRARSKSSTNIRVSTGEYDNEDDDHTGSGDSRNERSLASSVTDDAVSPYVPTAAVAIDAHSPVELVTASASHCWGVPGGPEPIYVGYDAIGQGDASAGNRPRMFSASLPVTVPLTSSRLRSQTQTARLIQGRERATAVKKPWRAGQGEEKGSAAPSAGRKNGADVGTELAQSFAVPTSSSRAKAKAVYF